MFDAPIARAMQATGFGPFIKTHMWVRDLLTAPGWAGFTAIVAVVVCFIHPQRLVASIIVICTTAVVGFNEILKWMVGRIRPYKLDEAGVRLDPWEFEPMRFYYVKNLCFTSGHTALAFATAAALGMLWPRWRWVWYSVASFVGVERVLENAHWLSDVVAGAALGVGGAYAVAWVLKSKWKISPQVINPQLSRS